MAGRGTRARMTSWARAASCPAPAILGTVLARGDDPPEPPAASTRDDPAVAVGLPAGPGASPSPAIIALVAAGGPGRARPGAGSRPPPSPPRRTSSRSQGR